MRFFPGLIFLIAFWMLAACQTPTKVYESQPVTAKAGENVPSLKPDAQTVILDARPAFQYALSHLNGSQSVQWTDFTQREAPFFGELEHDLFFHARRLARLGIDPATPVIVVGLAGQGHGEEGRVAWTLRYMGVKNVKFVSIDYFSLPLTQEEAEPRAAKPIWRPQVDPSLLVDRKTMVKLIARPRSPSSPVIVDVRSAREYMGKASTLSSKKAPDIGAINIPWTEFFDSKGLVVPGMKQKLEAVGITPDKTLYVISERGVESAAATLALRELGFSKAANFAGGYLELIEASAK
jgi:thiosulfate/3-mercaptopyruvate sulfurtransferase